MMSRGIPLPLNDYTYSISVIVAQITERCVFGNSCIALLHTDNSVKFYRWYFSQEV